MNSSRKNVLRKLVQGVSLVALAAAPALAQVAQTKPIASSRVDTPVAHADIVAPTVPGVLKPGQIVVNKRPAISFRVFPVVDPKTGAPVSCDKMILLPNGKSVTACQYWQEINNLEEKLNADGWTFRRGPGDNPGVPKPIPYAGIPTPVAKLQQQGHIAYLPSLQYHPLNVTQAVEKQRALPVIDPGLLKQIGTPINFFPNTLKEVKNWDLSFGDPSTFSVFLNGKVELDGTSTSTSLDAEANAGGSLFSQSFDVLQLSGKLNSPQNGPLNVTVNAAVLGKNVFNVNQSAPSTFSKSDSISKTLDKSVTVHFTLLDIPMSAKVGIQGTAGLSYAVTLAPVKATGSVSPSINTNAYAELAIIDIGIAAVGIGGKLTILNLNGNLLGSVTIVPGPTNIPTYNYGATYCQSLDTLDGSLFAFARVGDCPGTFCAEADFSFFSFSGIKSNGCLFSESNTEPVFSAQQRLPGKR